MAPLLEEGFEIGFYGSILNSAVSPLYMKDKSMFNCERFNSVIESRFSTPDSLDVEWARQEPDVAEKLLNEFPQNLQNNDISVITEAPYPQWVFLLPEILKRVEVSSEMNNLCHIMLWKIDELATLLEETGFIDSYTGIISECFKKQLESITIAKPSKNQMQPDCDITLPCILIEGFERNSFLLSAYNAKICVNYPNLWTNIIGAFFSESQGADIHFLDFTFNLSLFKNGRDKRGV